MGRIRVDLGRWSLTLTLALTLTVFTASVIAAHHFNRRLLRYICALSGSCAFQPTARSIFCNGSVLCQRCSCLCMGDEVVLSHGCPQCALVLLHANLLRACGSCDCGCHPRTSPECVLGGFGETTQAKILIFVPCFFSQSFCRSICRSICWSICLCRYWDILCLFVSRYNQAGQPRQVRDILLTLSLQFDDRAVADGGHTDR